MGSNNSKNGGRINIVDEHSLKRTKLKLDNKDSGYYFWAANGLSGRPVVLLQTQGG